MTYESQREKRKRFHDAKCRKGILLRTRYNTRKIKKTKISDRPVSRVRHPYILKAPKVLSIFGDTSSALNYFGKVIETISLCKFGDLLFFDLSEVEIITPDAIMYLIAVIKNIKRLRMLKINCVGNTPKNQSAREIIDQSGFFAFVSSTTPKKVDTDSRYMKILSGRDANGKLASSFCDFVHRVCKKDIRDTKRLYPMIIELMTNTHQHAYGTFDRQQIMTGNWYIFAQDMGATVHFVFLDTGVGIPKTVTKRFRERIKDLLLKDDAMYLKSALQGDFRSETGQEHRGKGLPGIYEDACNDSIERLSIISGKGKCTVSGSDIETECFSQTFEGTLFIWDMLKERS